MSSMRSRTYVYLGCAVLVVLVCAATWVVFTRSAPPTAVDWYASAERLDPIFAVDGTGPAKLRSAIVALLAQRNQILNSLQGTSTAQVGRAIYPDDFLNLLPKLQAARDVFLTTPTPQNAQTYHALLMATIDAYRTDAERLAQAIRNASLPGDLTFEGGAATAASEAQALDEAAAAAGAQAQKEKARYICAQYFDAGTCPSIAELSAAQAAALTVPGALPPPGAQTLSADVLEQPLVRYSNPGLTDLTPIIAIASSTCTTYPVTYLRGWRAPLPDGTFDLKAYFANDVYFYDLSKLTQPNIQALYVQANAEGVKYEYQNMANSYMCPDYGILAADLMRVESMRELAAASSSPLAQQLTSGPYLGLSDAATFAQATASSTAAERYIEGSANFDQILNGLRADNIYVLTLDSAGGWMDASFFLVARNYASTLFLFGNPTFVPNKISMLQKEGSFSQDPALHSWRYDLSQKIGSTTLINIADRAADLIRFKGALQ